jgi:hypothetical protein
MKESGNKAEDVRQLVETELNQMTNFQLKDALMKFLVPPYLQIRTWEYSLDKERLPCWIIANLQRHDLGLSFSEFGHGSYGNRWGIVHLSETYFGRDDSWFLFLEDAFITSGSYGGPLPDDYEIR